MHQCPCTRHCSRPWKSSVARRIRSWESVIPDAAWNGGGKAEVRKGLILIASLTAVIEHQVGGQTYRFMSVSGCCNTWFAPPTSQNVFLLFFFDLILVIIHSFKFTYCIYRWWNNDGQSNALWNIDIGATAELEFEFRNVTPICILRLTSTSMATLSIG